MPKKVIAQPNFQDFLSIYIMVNFTIFEGGQDGLTYEQIGPKRLLITIY